MSASVRMDCVGHVAEIPAGMVVVFPVTARRVGVVGVCDRLHVCDTLTRLRAAEEVVEAGGLGAANVVAARELAISVAAAAWRAEVLAAVGVSDTTATPGGGS